MCAVRQMPDKLEITKVNIREVCFCLYTSVLQIYPVSVKAIFQHSTLLVTNTSAISLSNGNTFKYFCFLPYPPDLDFLWVWELFKGPESTSGEKKGWSTHWREKNWKHHSFIQLTSVSALHIATIDLHLWFPGIVTLVLLCVSETTGPQLPHVHSIQSIHF